MTTAAGAVDVNALKQGSTGPGRAGGPQSNAGKSTGPTSVTAQDIQKIKDIHPDDWNNIPVPLCDSIKVLAHYLGIVCNIVNKEKDANARNLLQ